MSICYLSLGSNIGDGVQNLEKAVLVIAEKSEIEVLERSSYYCTQPIGLKNQPDFVNAAVMIKTTLDPVTLLQILKQVESDMGRKNTVRDGPRIIDLDILFYDDLKIDTEELSIPHRLYSKRRFVLEPLAEIAPQFICPISRQTIRKILEMCSDNSQVKKI